MRKLFLLFSILIFHAAISVTAQTIPDSVQSEINSKKSDTSKVMTMIRFADQFTYDEFDLSLRLSRMALKKSIEIKFKKGEVNSLDAIAYTHKEHFNLDSAEFYAKIFLAKTKKYNLPDEQVTARMILAGLSYNRGEYEKSNNQYKSILKLALKIKDHRGVSSIYNNIGLNYDETQKYDSAILWYTKSLNYRLKHEKDKTIIAHNYLNIGVTYVNKGDFEEGINFHYKAIKIFKQAKEMIGVAKAYSNIGVIASFSDDWKKSLKSYLSAFKIFKKMDDQRMMASTIMNIGTAYENLGLIDTALHYYQKSLAIYVEEQDTLKTAQCYNNIGSIELSHKNYAKAFENFNKALEIKLKYNERRGLSLTYYNLATTEMEIGKTDAAIQHLNLSLKLGEETGTKDNIKNAYQGLSECYALKKNFALAYANRLKYEEISDSIIGLEKQKKFIELEEKYKAAEKETKILELEKIKSQNKLEIQEGKSKNAESERDRLIAQRWVVILGFSVVLIIALSFLISLRIKQRTEKEKNKAIINEKEAGIKSVIFATEEERKRIAKDLHDGIGQQLGGLKLAWQKLIEKENNSLEKEKLRDLSKILDETAQDVRAISHQMMPRVLSEFGLVPAIEDMLKKSLLNSEIKYEYISEGMENRLPETIEISLYRICQELINNIIKHSGANFVSVQLMKSKSFIILIVEDNGKGFQMGKSSEGIGLQNISNRVNIINGSVNFERGEKNGTSATIHIPFQNTAHE